jgi:hypothetical protein
VAQHAGRDVDTDRKPAQRTHKSGVGAGAASHFEARASTVTEQTHQRDADLERVVLIAGEKVVLVVRDYSFGCALSLRLLATAGLASSLLSLGADAPQARASRSPIAS